MVTAPSLVARRREHAPGGPPPSTPLPAPILKAPTSRNRVILLSSSSALLFLSGMDEKNRGFLFLMFVVQSIAKTIQLSLLRKLEYFYPHILLLNKKVHMTWFIRHYKLHEMVAEQGVEFHANVVNLCCAYSEFSPVQDDGECFYRSFIFLPCKCPSPVSYLVRGQ